ncbi:dTMP kinase [Halorhodospira abdelmalekii]|uniref:dTMP kinase n=1 Tax=Halorhodospira abdelmalekii TaxID=421629 RepID=UPI001906C1E4|nr:dTMP kinase [Halorhodospira abdelmalekii]MBK1734635.1 dTMP kinase [Halorhodospira abdelmalekii]
MVLGAVRGSGCLITVEGIEGAGKTTCLEAVAEVLAVSGVAEPLFTREPGGTPLGERLRSVLLDRSFRGMSADAEALLLFAARAEHLAQVIRPALQAGRWVVSDRFTDASYAYQGGGRELGEARIAALERWLEPVVEPDWTLLLDVAPDVGRQRIEGRGEAPDRFEQEQSNFFDKVRAAYLQRAAAEPQRFIVIDAAAPAAAVAEQVRTQLLQALRLRQQSVGAGAS